MCSVTLNGITLDLMCPNRCDMLIVEHFNEEENLCESKYNFIVWFWDIWLDA